MRPIPRLAPLLALLPLAPTALAQHVLDVQVGNGTPNGPLGIDDGALSPDGRWLVLSDDATWTRARVHDLWNPGPPAVHDVQHGLGGEGCRDSVVVTDERAAVLGTGVLLLDLTQPGAPPVADHPVGDRPHDLALSEGSGTLCVRGGSGAAGGSFVFDLASGAQLLHLPGELAYSPDPNQFLALDSVVASDRHAVFLSELNLAGAPTTRVQVVDLAPPGGGPPVLVLETGGGTDLNGQPIDLALSPDGQHVAVRSENDVALFSLGSAGPVLEWSETILSYDQVPVQQFDSSVDAIALSDTHVLTTFYQNDVLSGMDLFDLAGNRAFFHEVFGRPHDLGITPDGTRALVRTEYKLALWEIPSTFPANPWIYPDVYLSLGSHVVGIEGGFDTLVLNDRHAVVLARQFPNSVVQVHDISAGDLEVVATLELEGFCTDLALSPSGDHVVVSGLDGPVVIDLRLGRVVLDLDVVAGGEYGRSDGVAMGDGVAAAFGRGDHFGSSAPVGWVTALDLFEEPSELCTGAANSTGAAGLLVPTGSARASANDLVLWATDVPAGEFGAFRYGDQAVALPFGDGTLCVGGQAVSFAPTSNGGGTVSLPVDATALPPGGGALVAGSTWHFQYAYRDPGVPGGAGFNATSATTVTIEP